MFSAGSNGLDWSSVVQSHVEYETVVDSSSERERVGSANTSGAWYLANITVEADTTGSEAVGGGNLDRSFGEVGPPGPVSVTDVFPGARVIRPAPLPPVLVQTLSDVVPEAGHNAHSVGGRGHSPCLFGDVLSTGLRKQLI